MKTKLIAVLLVAAGIITVISCNWLKSKSKSEAFNIQGKWIVDSMENKSIDSSNNIGMLAMALASKDSVPLGLEFKHDNTFNYINAKDSTGGKYYVAEDNSTLYVKEDSAYHPLQFIYKNDSAFSVISADSLIIHLRKEK